VLEQAGEFPFTVEPAQQSQTKINTELERAEASLRNSHAVEQTAAKDLVRLFFDILSRFTPKALSQESHLDNSKRENQELRDLQTLATGRLDEANAKLTAVTAEYEQLKTQFTALNNDVNKLQSQLTSDPCPWADPLETLRREHKEQLSTIAAVTAENERLKSQLITLKDDVSQLRNQAILDPPPWAESLETLRREHAEQISQLKDKLKFLQGLPENLDQLRTEIIAKEEDAILKAKHFDSKLEDLGREVSRKGSHLAIKGLENQLLALRNELKDVSHTHNQTSNQEENMTVQEARQLLQALKKEKDTQLEEAHVIITSDMQRIEHGMNEKIDNLHSQMNTFQDRIQAFKEVYGDPVTAATAVTEQHEGSKALPLSQQIKDVESQVDTLQATVATQAKLLDDRLQSLDRESRHTSLISKQVEPEYAKALGALSQSIDTQLQTHKNQLADLDRNLTTLMRAQMSSDDREALEIAKSLGRRMEKQEHQHQYLTSRFDNLTTESLHRQMIGYVAPALPRLEQGLHTVDLGMGALEKRVADVSSQLKASESSLQSRIQLAEENLTGFISRSKEQYETLAKEFKETCDDVLPKLKDLDSSHEEQKTRMQQISERQAEHEKDRKQAESIQNSAANPSSPRSSTKSPGEGLARVQSRPPRRLKSSRMIKTLQPPPKQQKAAKGEWVGSDSSSDELELSKFDSNALLDQFTKPMNREDSHRSSRALSNSVRSPPATAQKLPTEVASGHRKRKRNISPAEVNLNVNENSESDEDVIISSRKRVHNREAQKN